MQRIFFILCGVHGLTAVALGAFGAHGLTKRLADLPDAAKRLGWWETAAHYQLTHALALAIAGWLVTKLPDSHVPTVAGWAFAAGALIFSGTLYTMTLTGIRWLGAITPIGGLSLLVGWAALIVAAAKLPS